MQLQNLFPIGSTRRKLLRRLFLDRSLPAHLKARHRAMSDVPLEIDLDQDELGDSFAGRVAIARHYVAPWLDRARSLAGARVLEIGCGRGASTVALAEQGCEVTAVDLDEEALALAKARTDGLGLPVRFITANANEAAQRVAGEKFDFVIFYASLEHMTHEERLAAIRNTWELLPKGAFWCVTGTPNRLWHFDYHTAYLPFYFWLPDDLAYAYAQRSSRKNFRELYGNGRGEDMMHFLRRGRGLSFHEFDLAIKPAAQLDVVSSMPIELREQRRFNRWRWKFKRDFRFITFLRQAAPEIHPGFFEKSLDLIIRKD